MKKLTLADAKLRLRIPELWHRFDLPGQPGHSCRCPFHPDRSNSFSVYDDGRRWKCFAGCGGGSAVDFVKHARQLSTREACREILALAGGGFACPPRASQPPPADRPPPPPVVLPEMTPGNPAQCQTLATLRKVSLAALSLATQRGLLAFGSWCRRPAWFVTDSTRHVAQARRMDGKPWPEIGDKKAYTICSRGNGSWPVGTVESQPFPFLAWVEGGPDLLAAFQFIAGECRAADCSPVAMLGASLAIHREALPYFTAKRIRIFGHSEASGAGRRAVERWADQLTHAGATVDAFDFAHILPLTGSPAQDLNDCTSIPAEKFAAQPLLRRLLP